MSADEESVGLGISSLKPAAGSRKKTKRLGRGTSAGQGRTCGKGHKGQKSRSGYTYRPAFEGGQMPIQRRLPKRGFTNAPFRKAFQIVNLKRLSEVFSAGQEVTPESLQSHGLIKKAHLPVKILADGELKVALKVQVHAASRSAEEKIKAAGGEVKLIC